VVKKNHTILIDTAFIKKNLTRENTENREKLEKE